VFWCADVWGEGPLLAGSGGSVHVDCIYIPSTSLWASLFPHVFLGVSTQSKDSHTCIVGKVAQNRHTFGGDL